MATCRRGSLKGWDGALLGVLLGVAGATAAGVQGITLVDRDGIRLDMELHTVGRAQALDHDADDIGEAGFERERVAAGFQHAIGNIGWRFQHEDTIEVFFDATMASRTHADKWWGHQGYMLVRRLPDGSPLAWANRALDHVDIKLGHFVVDFGNGLHRRSFNADTQSNPLVGNPIVSPHATEAGAEIIHRSPSGLGLMAGLGSGVATENYTRGTRLSYRAKAWLEPTAFAGFEAAASFYRIQHGDDIARGSNLFRTERLGGQYAGIWDDGNAPGQVVISNGTNLTAWQLDAGWQPNARGGIWGHFGRVDDGRDETEETWNYYGVTGLLYLQPEVIYLAVRYSAADARLLGGGSDAGNGRLERWQGGAGVHVLPRMLFKLEYVEQRARGFTDATLSGVELGQNPRFSGVIAEVSFSF